MCYQRTNTIDPIGPTWDSQEIDWSWHQWAESSGKQYDPSANAIFNGSWGGYEDTVFKEYKRCTAAATLQQQLEQAKQASVSVMHALEEAEHLMGGQQPQ